MSEKYQDRWIAERKKGKIYVTHKDDHTLNKKFDTVNQAKYYVQSVHPNLIYDDDGNYQGYNKPKVQTPTALDHSRERIKSGQFADPIQARADSVKVFKATGDDQFEPADDKKKRLTDRSIKLVEDITVAENQLNQSAFKDKHHLIQKNLDNLRSELQSISSELGVKYELPSGDANIDQGGFTDWVGGKLKGVADYLRPSDEEAFKRNTRQEIMSKLVKREITPPEGVSNYDFASSEANRLWEEQVNKVPVENQSTEDLIKTSNK